MFPSPSPPSPVFAPPRDLRNVTCSYETRARTAVFSGGTGLCHGGVNLLRLFVAFSFSSFLFFVFLFSLFSHVLLPIAQLGSPPSAHHFILPGRACPLALVSSCLCIFFSRCSPGSSLRLVFPLFGPPELTTRLSPSLFPYAYLLSLCTRTCTYTCTLPPLGVPTLRPRTP